MLSLLRFKDRLFYGWVVLIAIAIIGTVFLGVYSSFGVFFKVLASEFGLLRATTSAIVSVQAVFGGIFAFLGGWAIDRYGPRIIIGVMGSFAGLGLLLTSQTSSAWQLFITYSLLLAVGTGAIYVVILSIALRWFSKKQGLAVGIASSGGGVGLIIMPPFVTYLIASFDWRTAFIILGLITLLIVLPLSRFLRRDPHTIGALPNGVKSTPTDEEGAQPKTRENSFQTDGLSLVQAIRTRSLWLFISTWLLWSFSMLLVSIHIVPHATDIGFSDAQAATILSLFGGSAIVGRVLLGILADRTGRKLTAVICFLFQAGALLWLLWAQELWMLYVFALVSGFITGGVVPIITTLVGDTFGLHRIGTILGVLEVGFAVGAALGPFIGGLIFDIKNSYSLSFIIVAVTMVVGTVCIGLVRRERRGDT